LAALEEWNEKQRTQLDTVLATSTCHQAAAKKNPALAGKVRLSLHYRKDDPKPKVDIEASSIADCQLAACIQRLAEKTAAHATPPETSFTYTLEFKANAAPARSTVDVPIDGKQCASSPTATAAKKVPAAPSGSLPPAVIQSTVRDNYEKMRKCYEQGLARDATLTGRVAVRFIINRDGTVSNASVSANDIPDCDVTRCVANVFQSLQFPKPEGGIVTVVYPVMFAPG
jgi:TonB family protein